MYRLIKTYYQPTKTSLLALAISLGLERNAAYALLKKGGYVLSESIAFDIVIKWLLENIKRNNGKNDIFYINDVLYELELPLLMTREKL